MKKLLLALALIASTDAFAKGSSYPPVETATSAKPCMIQLSARSWINANTITVITPSRNDYVYVYYGHDHFTIETGEGRQDSYIANLIATINQTCH